MAQLTYEQFKTMWKYILDFKKKNGRYPNYIDIFKLHITKTQFLDMKERVDSFIKDLGRNPKVVGITGPVDEPRAAPIDPTLKPFLQATKNCQSDNPSIIKLAKQIVGNETSNYNKAHKIFEWVRIQKDYVHYYRTSYGALGMVASKIANCYDLSHLLIALCRAAGLPARYHSVVAKFNSVTEGHMFGEIYVDNLWYKADASHDNNRLGKITNWTLATDRGTYREITT